MNDDTEFRLSDRFLRSASPHFSDPMRLDTPSMAIRRPPVPERAASDFGRVHMAGYLDGLERRLVRHLERHMPLWHRKETVALLNKWNALENNHPAPTGVAPRNRLNEASEYAAHNVEGRIAQRFQPIEAARMKSGLYDDSTNGMIMRANRVAQLRDKMIIT